MVKQNGARLTASEVGAVPSLNEVSFNNFMKKKDLYKKSSKLMLISNYLLH